MTIRAGLAPPIGWMRCLAGHRLVSGPVCRVCKTGRAKGASSIERPLQGISLYKARYLARTLGKNRFYGGAFPVLFTTAGNKAANIAPKRGNSSSTKGAFLTRFWEIPAI